MFASNRRQFLGAVTVGSGVLSFGIPRSQFLQAAAAKNAGGRILLVIELAGGNDGLNTIVPFQDEAYYAARPKLAIPRTDVIRITDEIGLHPALKGLAELLEAGQLAVVQGVGYDNPNRSHFESMDIWHTCLRKDEPRPDGWLGRCLEQLAESNNPDPAALHLGADKQPFALMSRQVRIPSIRSLTQFRLDGTDNSEFRRMVRELADARRAADNDLLSFVQSSTSSAIAASERIEATGKDYTPATPYPATDLGEKLKTVSRLINSGLATSVYYVQLDGFDTHAQQPEAHAGLLRQVGDAVNAMMRDLEAQGHGDRVLTMCFSEFGRRVAENASDGTDHGTAGPMFLIGRHVRAGLSGDHPKLDDLQDGDLKHHTDFRQVYAAVLEHWLGCDSEAALRGRFQPVPVLRNS